MEAESRRQDDDCPGADALRPEAAHPGEIEAAENEQPGLHRKQAREVIGIRGQCAVDASH